MEKESFMINARGSAIDSMHLARTDPGISSRPDECLHRRERAIRIISLRWVGERKMDFGGLGLFLFDLGAVLGGMGAATSPALIKKLLNFSARSGGFVISCPLAVCSFICSRGHSDWVCDLIIFQAVFDLFLDWAMMLS